MRRKVQDFSSSTWNRVQIPQPSIQATQTRNSGSQIKLQPLSCVQNLHYKRISSFNMHTPPTELTIPSFTPQPANQSNSLRAPCPFRRWVELVTYLVSHLQPLFTAHSSLPSLRPRRRARIHLAPTRRIRTRAHDRLGSRIFKLRTRHHAVHNPRTPGDMCRHTRGRADFDCSRSRPRAAPHRRAGDDVFRCARGG
jgi:hypothetical protein